MSDPDIEAIAESIGQQSEALHKCLKENIELRQQIINLMTRSNEEFGLPPQLNELAAIAIYEKSMCGEEMCGPERHCYCRVSAKAALDAMRWYYDTLKNDGTSSGGSG